MNAKCLFLLFTASVILKCVVCADSKPEDEDIEGDEELPSDLVEIVPETVLKKSNNSIPNTQKSQFSEERFAHLFNVRTRRPRLTNPRYIITPRPTLPSFIRNTAAYQRATFAPPIAQTARAVVASRIARTTAAPIRTTTQSSRARSLNSRNDRNDRTTSSTQSPASADRRSRVRDQLTASGQLPAAKERRFGGTFRSSSTTPRSQS